MPKVGENKVGDSEREGKGTKDRKRKGVTWRGWRMWVEGEGFGK